MIKEFVYLDVQRVAADGVQQRWKRIHKRLLAEAVERFDMSNPLHVFHTIQFFKNADHIADEEHLCDFFIDMDAENLNNAKSDTQKVLDYLFTIGCDEDIKVWFSGNRGFHITVDYTYFNAQPSKNLTKVWRYIAEHLADKLSLASLDRSVYTRRRMWRVPNTRHGKSGLYKIELYSHELGMSVNSIRELASSPREELEIGKGDQ